MIYSVSHTSDVLAITETRLNDDIYGYNFHYTDSITKSGGGAIYVRNNKKTVVRPDISVSIQLVESCWVEIEASKFSRNANRNIIECCIYRHSRENIEKYTEELDELFKHLSQCKYQVILLYIGDVT